MPLDRLIVNEETPSPELVEEYLATLQRRRAFLVGQADERQRRGLPVLLELRESAALGWGLSILEGIVKERR